jgi:hypothetical protein
MVYEQVSVISTKIQVAADIPVRKKAKQRPIQFRSAYRKIIVRSLYGYGSILLVMLLFILLA